MLCNLLNRRGFLASHSVIWLISPPWPETIPAHMPSVLLACPQWASLSGAEDLPEVWPGLLLAWPKVLTPTAMTITVFYFLFSALYNTIFCLFLFWSAMLTQVYASQVSQLTFLSSSPSYELSYFGSLSTRTNGVRQLWQPLDHRTHKIMYNNQFTRTLDIRLTPPYSYLPQYCSFATLSWMQHPMAVSFLLMQLFPNSEN
jgi:hypothetical protein